MYSSGSDDLIPISGMWLLAFLAGLLESRLFFNDREEEVIGLYVGNTL
jgi:hypothetical protein